MSDDPKTTRSPPPSEHQFLKGQSGNGRGRPKGAVSLKRLTRKVALKKHTVKINGKTVRDTLLNLVVSKLTQDAGSGNPSMVKLKRNLRSRLSPQDDEEKGGLLVVPRVLSPEEWNAQAERHNATARNPETYINHEVEEWLKALRGESSSKLGEALVRFHNRWYKN